MPKVPLIDLAAQHKPLRAEILKGWKKALELGHFVQGENVRAFEAEAAKYLGVKHAIACNSGTDALVILLRAAGVGPGDEVIVPAFSFFATAEAVSLCGATPVFCDIREDDFLLDVKLAEKLVTKKTKALVPVHLYGLPMDLRPLARLGLKIVEDSCQAFGAKGCSGAFSFYPTKNLSAAGDAGLMATDDEATAVICRKLREHGSPRRYVHDMVGYNSRMDELQAVVLRAKLKRLKAWTAKRRAVAKAYLAGFKGLPLTLPPASSESVWHQFTLRTPKRDALKAHLEARGIGSAVFYPAPMNVQAPYKGSASCPVAEKAGGEVLSLPIFPEMSQAQIKAVVAGVRTFYDS